MTEGERLQITILNRHGHKVKSEWKAPSRAIRWILDVAIEVGWFDVITGLEYMLSKDQKLADIKKAWEKRRENGL